MVLTMATDAGSSPCDTCGATRLLLAVCLGIAACQTIETAPLRMDTLTTQVPLELVRPSEMGVWPVVTLRVGDRQARFVVDTGTNVIGVSERLARDLPAGSRSSIVARSGGTDDHHRVVRLPEVVIGDAILPSQDAVVVRYLDDLNQGLGANIDGILGEPFFRDVLVTLDYEGSSLHITTLPLSGPSVPIQIRGGSPVVEIDLVGTGKEPFLLDTGSSSGIRATSDSRLGRALGDRSHLPGYLDDLGVAHSVGVAPAVHLAQLTFPAATVIISDELPPDQARVGRVGGLVGSGLLLGCRLSIEYRSRRLALTRSGPAPTARGGWGLAVRWGGDGLVVTQVLAGSPADAAGLRKGDRIRQVGGLGRFASAVAFCTWLDAHESVAIEAEREGTTQDVRLNRAVYLPPLLGP